MLGSTQIHEVLSDTRGLNHRRRQKAILKRFAVPEPALRQRCHLRHLSELRAVVLK